MKKRIVSYLLLACVIVNAVSMTGCGSSEDMTSAEINAESQVQADEHTVTFYDSDGTTVLDTATVAHKEKVESFIPEKDGYTFVGWFATPKLTREFDFDRAITEDTPLYAGFVSYTEDTREFYIVGSGTSDVLSESDWGKVIGESQKFTKEDVKNENVYTITLELNEGDQFQFATDSSWSNQRGYGYLESGMFDGATYFKNSGGLGDTPAEKSNIEVAVAGTYTFVLTTYPGEDVYDEEDPYYTEETRENFNSNPYDKITWNFVE
ncbi:Listeria/Bacterioides repeat-containing protein [Pseudobutyrivibrio sp. UC1225]|uniref:InlB B-repeat-containing protein n=1 Tax=Pseudobutyrivibrio sp. UC1225 TaxID=1798185 RepID=UPI0008EC4D64|nr:InlB B-repeat-containing protein [Pseudobutyrivibrio sp. UC1225]SFN65658.1 Listeria/Bacterioides repeat-containing protein [Pseudobutyrivibrio sp. UC1225]